MNLNKPSAFKPFMDAPVKVTTERRVNGVADVQSFELAADVRPGASPGAATMGQARFMGDIFTVTFPAESWGIAQDPAVGDRYTHAIYGTLYAETVQRDDEFWMVSCVAKQGALR